MIKFDPTIQAQGFQHSLSLLERNLNEVRMKRGSYPAVRLFLYADLHFNLRNDPKFPFLIL